MSLVPCLQPRARLETGGAQVEVGGGTRGWRLETGDWRQETGDTRLEAPAELAQSLDEASILLALREPQALHKTLLLPQKTCQSTPGSST
jgi:hypothetical protein